MGFCPNLLPNNNEITSSSKAGLLENTRLKKNKAPPRDATRG